MVEARLPRPVIALRRPDQALRAVARAKRGVGVEVDRESVLFVTLDSCRYDSFRDAATPAMDVVAPLHAAVAPCHFTYGSHAAMFMGFTPAVTTDPVPLLNPKYAKLFKLRGPAFGGKGGEGYVLDGRDVIDGFARRGFATYGTGAVRWFDPATPVSDALVRSFGAFFYAGSYWRGAEQVAWLTERIAGHDGGKVFAFLNLGETHTPYWHEGADWSREDNPCIPFQTVDRRAECRDRQIACLEYLDDVLAPLLARFAGATVLICGDHGDCWGEDGLWEHGIPHRFTLEVPLLMRVRGVEVRA